MVANQKTKRGKVVKVKAWAVVDIKTREIQVSTIMSKGLRDFYNRTEAMRCVPCVISYKLK